MSLSARTPTRAVTRARSSSIVLCSVAFIACGASTELEQRGPTDAGDDIVEADNRVDASRPDVVAPDVSTEIRGWDPIGCEQISQCNRAIWDSGVPLTRGRFAFVCCERQCVAGTLCPVSFEPRGLCGPDGPPCDLATGELCCFLPTGYQCLRVGRRGCPTW
jgi:hypothetical protein